MKKVQKALSVEGTKFIHVHAPCPTGWRYSTEKSVEIGKLAVKTGMWFLYEYENGKVTLSAPTSAALKKPTPVEDYIRMQGRFKGVDIASLKKEVDSGADRIRGLVQ
jgi:pyruvate ferredoxin oxidoreductase beta subunit